MKPLPTLLLAVPAALAGFVGAMGLASSPDPGTQVAAMWGTCQFTPLDTDDSRERWTGEAKRRKVEFGGLNKKKGELESQKNDTKSVQASLTTKKGDVEKLLKDLDKLETISSKSEQERIRPLAGWMKSASECLAPILTNDGQSIPQDLASKQKDILELIKGIKQSDPYDKRQNQVRDVTSALKEFAQSIDASQKQLDVEQKALEGRLAKLRDDFKHLNRTP